MCDIPLDPSKDKRIIHLETCAGNIEEGDNVVEEVKEIDYDDVELDETEEIEGVTASEGDGESKGDGEIGMDIKALVEDKEISLEIDDDNDHLEEENVSWQVKEDNQHEGVGEDNLDENNNLAEVTKLLKEERSAKYNLQKINRDLEEKLAEANQLLEDVAIKYNREVEEKNGLLNKCETLEKKVEEKDVICEDLHSKIRTLELDIDEKVLEKCELSVDLIVIKENMEKHARDFHLVMDKLVLENDNLEKDKNDNKLEKEKLVMDTERLKTEKNNMQIKLNDGKRETEELGRELELEKNNKHKEETKLQEFINENRILKEKIQDADEHIKEDKAKMKEFEANNLGLAESLEKETKKRQDDKYYLKKEIKDFFKFTKVEGCQEKKLGEGVFGEVFEIKHKDKVVAVKRFKEITIDNMKEAAMMIKLKHPNVMAAKGIMFETDDMLLVMKRLDTDLDKYLDVHGNDDRKEWRRKVFVDATKAVAYLHRNNIIHRDIKPENLLMKVNKNEIEEVVLSDFGLANIGLESTLRVGTPGYISPEMLVSDTSIYNEKVDIWSLGATLFEVLTNENLVRDAASQEEQKSPKVTLKDALVDMEKEIQAVRMMLIMNKEDRIGAEAILSLIIV